VDVKSWDTYDTVFKVKTSGQRYFHDSGTMKATASSSRAGHPASNLVEGNFENHWDADGKQPVSLTLDLGRRRTATYLAVNQREMSPTYARESFGRPEDSSRTKDYRVYVSDDGRNWGEPVRIGAMPSARGVQFIDFGERQTRFLRLEVLNTWPGPRAKPFYRQLAIDDIKVAYGYPNSVLSARVPLEAESFRNDHDGRAHFRRCSSCSGSFQVTGLGGGARTSVTYPGVTVAEAGDYRLQLDTTGGPATSVAVSVNGGAPVEIAIDAGTSGIVASAAIPVTLKAGADTVKVFSNAPTGLGLDRIAIAPLPPPSYTPKTNLTVEPGGVQWLSPGRQFPEGDRETAARRRRHDRKGHHGAGRPGGLDAARCSGQCEVHAGRGRTRGLLDPGLPRRCDRGRHPGHRVVRPARTRETVSEPARVSPRPADRSSCGRPKTRRTT